METSQNTILPTNSPNPLSTTPQFPTNLPGTFWGITTIFNPANYKNKLENYKLFRENSKRQGLNLITIELAFDNEPYQINEKDSDILVQIRGDSKKNVMWQKEALLNIGLKKLPLDCDKVMWIDSDIIFKNENWIEQTSKLLEKYLIVQPFAYSIRLPKGLNNLTEEEIKNLKEGYNYKEKIPGFVFSKNLLPNRMGGTGYAWAFRKELITKYGFFHEMILGGADTAMALAFCNAFRESPWLKLYLTPKISASYQKWAESMHNEVLGSVAYLDGEIIHLWHGDPKERIYDIRYNILKSFNYIPEEDIILDSNGLIEWASKKPQLQKAVKEYFRFRNEEGKSILPSILVSEILTTRGQLRNTEEQLIKTKKQLTEVTEKLNQLTQKN